MFIHSFIQTSEQARREEEPANRYSPLCSLLLPLPSSLVFPFRRCFCTDDRGKNIVKRRKTLLFLLGERSGCLRQHYSAVIPSLQIREAHTNLTVSYPARN